MNTSTSQTTFSGTISIAPGAFVEEGVVLQENVILGANAVVLSVDQTSGKKVPAVIKAGATIGANATIMPGVVVGERALIKPGSVVTHSVPPLAIVEGNPAIISGYLSTFVKNINQYNFTQDIELNTAIHSKVTGVTLHKFKYVSDLRGNLTVGEFEKDVPFTPKRYFLVLDVPTAETRGEHAHRQCEQFLICVKGSCSIVADNGTTREEFTLNTPSLGLYLPPMVWGIQYKYSSDAVLLVFASHYYDASDYIRDYKEFLEIVGMAK
jgi:carbonic anhydrase/acetyltransferase-like protein (isoleucine patch superfamily)